MISLNGWTHVDVRCLPAKLHSTPDRIPAAVDAKLRGARRPLRARLRRVRGLRHRRRARPRADRHEVERLPGAHCYGFLAGNDAWDAMQEDEPATFYLTDFLARHFDALVVRALKLDTHPELMPLVFGNYRRLVYLAQTDDPTSTGAPRTRPRSSASRTSVTGPATASSSRRSRGSSESPSVAELTVIWWRDIPAQVTAKEGRTRAARELPPRFQEAIDAAAMRAGLIGSRRLPRGMAARAAAAATISRRRSRRSSSGSTPRTPTTCWSASCARTGRRRGDRDAAVLAATRRS